MTELEFTRSSRCHDGGCVEVAKTPEGVAIRDSKDSDGPVLRFDQDEYAAFIAGVKAGEFDFDTAS